MFSSLLIETRTLVLLVMNSATRNHFLQVGFLTVFIVKQKECGNYKFC